MWTKRIVVLPLSAKRFRSDADAQNTATVIYRYLRDGARVVALLDAETGGLARALDRCGVPSDVIAPNAPEPLGGNAVVCEDAVRSALDRAPIVLVQRAVRGASELARGRSAEAIALARRLGAAAVVRTGTTFRAARPVRVALLGHGTVGGGVFERLTAEPDRFEVVGVAVRDVRKHIGVPPLLPLLSADPWEVIRRPCDVVIELMGGVEPAGALIRAAIASGRHVVTANKHLIATRGPALQSRANAAGVALLHSAAVGGAAPMVEAVRGIAATDRVVRLDGVLNGTCNYVLDRLIDGDDLARAVRDAQDAGFAEADPRLDLSGDDAAHKLAILARAAFGRVLPLERIARRGLDALEPRDLRPGGVPRLVASAWIEDGAIRASVRPTRLAADHPFAQVANEANELRATRPDGSVISIRGKGAGRWPTAEAVLADLFDVITAIVPRPRALSA